jgi:uncharacterized protein (TIGR03435 family)
MQSLSRMQRWVVRFLVQSVFSVAVLGTCALAQGGPSDNRSSGDKKITFDVFSIRPSARDEQQGRPAVTPDGFTLTGVTMFTLIEMAYNPMTPRYWDSKNVVHLPSWANDERYSLHARVADEDLAIWQAQNDQNPDVVNITDTVRGALQAALHDRCNLAVTVTPTMVPVLDLTVGPHGARLRDSEPGGAKHVVGGSSLGDGGFYYDSDGRRHYRNVSMKEFVHFLMRFSEGNLIQDKTGLDGRYDFDLPYYHATDSSNSDPSSPLDRITIDKIGLRLRTGKGLSYLFDVKSLRRPDAN